MLTGAPFFELEAKDGIRRNKDDPEDCVEEQEYPDLTASLINRVLKSVQ